MKRLDEGEILTILRAADEIIASGGRTLLAKILKGSGEKKILELGLDACPVYGYFKPEKLDTVLEKIDWMIDHDFLDIQYSGKLPMIIFTDRGWEIERDQRVDEFLQEWDRWLSAGKKSPDMSYLKDRNRGMIWLLLDKIQETGNEKYIPYLNEWEKVDYKKVRARIREVVHQLETAAPIDRQTATERSDSINAALKGAEPHDIDLRCIKCGNYFTFSVGEQQFYKRMGFVHPRRCKSCREKRDLEFL
ncbi:RQC-minor-1 family DNA-binding protein [Lentibacillus amyloliquefaciens]|uniref:Superfamily II DNA helicase n=1 Tax=Lentibacillus amyloliquefaciens TaxID=1472767 RepID=A0A0U3WB73_9BACI|nr:RQC-minor-1 family DNA-binding protein [Lentibacillus amyloliquefaciens]ALX50210.1 superfamily II DNA helicase [Lentibacillus amyloliquefaciens]